VTTVSIGQAASRNGDIAVNGYRVAARPPYRYVRTAGQRANAGFRVHREQRGRESTVNSVAAALGNLVGAISCEL
jgi:hypothetical protein